MDWFHVLQNTWPTLCFQGAACESCGWPHPRIRWKASSGVQVWSEGPVGPWWLLDLGRKAGDFLGIQDILNAVTYEQPLFFFFGGQGCPCALVLLRQEWFATLFLDIRALRRTDLFDGVAVKHHMINAVHVTEAQKHCLRMLTLLDKLINWESFMLFHHFSTFFNRKCVYIGGSFPSNDVRLLETCRLTRSLGLAIGEDSGIIAEPQVEHMQCGENLIHWITCIIYLHV